MLNASTLQSLPSLRTPQNTYARHVRYTVLEFSNLLDSSSISSEGWSQIATTIQNNYSLFDGFVILHGTDSLAYTSSALSFMLTHLGKPVILTGSQASIFALQSDAVDNLIGSLIIAATFIIPEVCLFFHHTLYRGNRCTKISSTSLSAFASPNYEPLARISASGAEVNWSLIQRPKAIAKFEIQNHLGPAFVACFRIFPGMKPEMLDLILHVPHLQGLILETFGAGNAPHSEDGQLINVIKAAVARNIIIVNVSQCQSGSVSPLYASATALRDAGVIFGYDLTTEAALTKLTFLLGLPDISHDSILKKMQHSIRGEMTESNPTTFSHPFNDVLPDNQSAFTSLCHAITEGNLQHVINLLENDEYHVLQARDYAGNTALHLAALGPSKEILHELLKRGASVHARNRGNNTPLFLACQTRNDAFIELLGKAGALLHIEEKERNAGEVVKIMKEKS